MLQSSNLILSLHPLLLFHIGRIKNFTAWGAQSGLANENMRLTLLDAILTYDPSSPSVGRLAGWSIISSFTSNSPFGGLAIYIYVFFVLVLGLNIHLKHIQKIHR